ncbi:MAG: hypothetical protein GX591_10375 [Planctomycetes bacterium]|nr:hypothetical protein [Planctomycetota bacterium]
MVKVFVPTAPNPTTGFFLIVPSSAAVTTDLTVEEAFKMIISGGIVTPAALDGRLAAAWSSGSAAGEDSSPAGVQSVVR